MHGKAPARGPFFGPIIVRFIVVSRLSDVRLYTRLESWGICLMNVRLSLGLLALAVFSSSRVDAHHSFAAEFSYDDSGTIAGKVVEVLYVNPHVRYFVSIKDASGKEVLWDVQTRSPNALAATGWSKDTIRVGDEISIEGNLGRDNKRKIWIREVRKASGEVIRPTGEEPPP